VRCVRRTAQRIGREHDPVAAVDGVENGSEHADISFRSGDERLSTPRRRSRSLSCGSENGEYALLSIASAGGASAAKGGTKSISHGSIRSNVSSLQRCQLPGIWSGRYGGMKRLEDRARRVTLGNASHDREDPRHPGRMPRCLLGENILQIWAVRSVRGPKALSTGPCLSDADPARF
jgi:hypothetical protein